MNYNDALQFIHTASKLGSKLGLENISRLLQRLGNPQDSLKFIHIAGTNGKGTVTKTISEILRYEGYKVGMYTSPFIYKFNERIVVDGVEIDDVSLAEITTVVKEKCDEMVRDGYTHPTEFEIVTAIGFMYFAKVKCDVVVLEVGLGGRLDATNVIKNPLACIITFIDYDHMEYLGNTLSEIAFEKCGILKEGAPVISYPCQCEDAISVIKERTDEVGGTLYIAEKPSILKHDLSGSEFLYKGEKYNTKLIGEHMVLNISTAIECMQTLIKHGFKISEKSIKKGVENVLWQGRFEIISKNPLIIIDGAHNISGIHSLKKAIEDNFKNKKLTFVMGMLKDKEYDESLKVIAPLAEKIICCDVPSYRTLPGEILAKYAKKYNKNVSSCEIVFDAIKEAIKTENDAIIIFGSLYMLCDVKNAVDELK